MADSQTFARFHTTGWTVVRALTDSTENERHRAMELLTRRYWPPIYAWLRSQGRSPDEAADLTQEFFSKVVLGRSLLDRADQGRGKLRSLLLVALKHFLVDQHRRDVARGSKITIAIDSIWEEESACSLAAFGGDVDPYDRRWAMAVLEEAIERCERHFKSSNREQHWRLFEQWVLQPAITGSRPTSLAQAAEECGFASAALAASALQTVKNRAMGLLREVTAETVDDAEEVEAELALIRRYVSA